MNITLGGIPVHECTLLTVETEDWSGVRSRARAKRRSARGFRQNVKIRRIPDPNFYQTVAGYLFHPETLQKFLKNMGVAR